MSHVDAICEHFRILNDTQSQEIVAKILIPIIFLLLLFLQALFVLFAIAYVAAIPVDESVIGDSVDNFHPSDDQEILKKLLLKKLLLKKKLLLG